MTGRARVGVLISGRGSNMVALAAAAEAADYPAEIVVVLSNNPDAAGIDAARRHGIPGLAVDHRRFGPDRHAHEQQMQRVLQDHGVQLVCLAGYMRLLTSFLVAAWHGRMLNIHPSLLPAFPGLHTHARALAAGVKLHGCTVHQVTEVMDEGPIIAQAAVPVLQHDTPDSLAARVLAQEHRLYPLALRVHLTGLETVDASAALSNPGACLAAAGPGTLERVDQSPHLSARGVT